MIRLLAASALHTVAYYCDACATHLAQTEVELRQPVAGGIDADWDTIAVSQWGLMLVHFCLVAELAHSFSFRRMQLERATWAQYTDVLVSLGVVVKTHGRTTNYGIRANGLPWHRHALRHALRCGSLDVAPHLKRVSADYDPARPYYSPPPIAVNVTVTLAHSAQHTRPHRLIAQ